MSAAAVAMANLLTRSTELPEYVRKGLKAMGAEAVPSLVAILQDPSLDAEGHPARFMARRHAALLLGQIGDASAVQPLMSVFVRDDLPELLARAVMEAVPRCDGLHGEVLEWMNHPAQSEADRVIGLHVLLTHGWRGEAAVGWLRRLLPTAPRQLLPWCEQLADPTLGEDILAVLKQGDDLLVAGARALRACLGAHEKFDRLERLGLELRLNHYSEDLIAEAYKTLGEA